MAFVRAKKLLAGLTLVAWWLAGANAVFAADDQEPIALPRARPKDEGWLPSSPPQGFAADIDEETAAVGQGHCATPCRPGCPNNGLDDSSLAPCRPRLYGGADFLLVRTHFSEAIAFAEFTDSLVGNLPHEEAQARELNFSYDPAFRTHLGYHLNPCADFQFTYQHIGSSVAVGGSVAQQNQFIIDPFGNRANFGQSIQTQARVNLNAYDFDFVKPLEFCQACLSFRLAGGIRLADVRQSYSSRILDANDTMLSDGSFGARFRGVGPHLGVQAQTRRCSDSPFSLLARGGASFLVGDYNVSSGATIAGVAGGGQSASRTLTLPVLEAELGVVWQPTECFTAAAGWFVQTWSDLGASGGTFGGKFIEANDANIMAFDGLFVRSMLRY
jgi:hypothetical protein